MSFDSLMADTIEVLKGDGSVIKGIKASVQSKGIYVVGPPKGLLIEPDDLVRRTMSNGGVETFRVIDPGYHEGMSGALPPSYQMKVRKLGLPEAQQAVQHITYNISGANARVNDHSTDSSVNTVTNSSVVSTHIQALRKEIQKALLTAQQKAEAVDVVDAVEAQVTSGTPKKAVVTALLSSLPAIQAITAIGKNIYDVLHSTGRI